VAGKSKGRLKNHDDKGRLLPNIDWSREMMEQESRFLPLNGSSRSRVSSSPNYKTGALHVGSQAFSTR
jgi:hypothetical protein